MSALASSPSDSAASTAVVEDLQTVATTLNSTFSTLTTKINQLAQELTGGASSGGGLLGQVNGLYPQQARLPACVNIVAGNAGGLDTNALEDQRRNALSQLSGLIGIRTTTEPSGAVDIYAGSISLVQGPATSLSPRRDGQCPESSRADRRRNGGAGGRPDPSSLLTGNQHDDPVVFEPAVGDLRQSRDIAQRAPGGRCLPERDAPAQRPRPPAAGSGPTLPPIFVDAGSPTTYTYRVRPLPRASRSARGCSPIRRCSRPTAAGTSPAGVATIDPTVIQQMAALGQSGGGPDALYQQLVGTVGTQAQAANTDQTNAQSLANSITSNLSSVEGVNTDKETINMLTAQRDYQAMAQVINAMNASLQALLADV